MDRRQMLKGVGAAAGIASAAVATASASQAAASKKSIDFAATTNHPGVDGQMLVNKARAHAVLEEQGLDGLIALNPINVYYLTNTLSVMTKFREEIPAFATFARDPKQPSFLVALPPDAWDFANKDREVPELITYSAVSNWQDYVNASPERMRQEPKAASPRHHEVRQGMQLTAREKGWVDSETTYGANSSATSTWALAKALKESGLAKGKVAVDDMRIAYLLQQIGMTDVQCVPGENVFKHIRMVKSEPEIAIMRVAGYNNGVAAMNTIRAIEKGMRGEDVEQRFRAEAAALGNEMDFITAGTSIGLFPDGGVMPGKPFLVDAVSRYRQYMGDYARTVVIGEPSKEVLARAKANKIGRDAVFEVIKPGVKFSELRTIATEAQVKAGMPRAILTVTPHSVGLQHADHSARLDMPFNVPVDHVLEENMVLTIDLPYVEVGWGAGHNEDLIRITKTGYEALNTESDPLVII